MSRRLAALVLAVGAGAVLLAVVLFGVLGGEDAPDPAPTPSPTPAPVPEVALADLDTLTTAVRREEFCADVDPGAVERALGAEPTDTASYTDGDNARVTGSVRDIAHEFGCGWTAAGTNVRAWVFAPPVTPRTATGLVRAASREEGCRADPQAPAFGRPSVGLVCETRRGVQTSFRGLFGDAWLTCTFTGRVGPDEAVERADRWCGAVLTALTI